MGADKQEYGVTFDNELKLALGKLKENSWVQGQPPKELEGKLHRLSEEDVVAGSDAVGRTYATSFVKGDNVLLGGNFGRVIRVVNAYADNQEYWVTFDNKLALGKLKENSWKQGQPPKELEGKLHRLSVQDVVAGSAAYMGQVKKMLSPMDCQQKDYDSNFRLQKFKMHLNDFRWSTYDSTLTVNQVKAMKYLRPRGFPRLQLPTFIKMR